ncbi:hypothetical protein EYF80_057616 [Liparis tanakae]|uniref:Uncharacterized protein n=1 Tax=Liparis tanakae TaxID=230148 RepID=A0A4Z2EV35_9TELE|nr:hypothetical protein EYF80_057616 [Liparis tanakae]
MSFLACHMRRSGLWGRPGLVQGRGFSKPALPSARPAAPAPHSRAGVLQLGRQRPATGPHPGVYHNVMHMDRQADALLCGQY